MNPGLRSWIGHGDRPTPRAWVIVGPTVRTTDHDQIIAWAEARGGRPVRAHGGDDPAEFRLEFSGLSGPPGSLQPISWEEFFEGFERAGLALEYEEDADHGVPTRAFRLVPR